MRGRVVAIVNERAGAPRSGTAGDLVAEALRRHGLSPEVRAVAGGAAGPAAREAVEAGADLVVACGGDGTVSAVAAEVAGSASALAVLPLGTLNHFAHDAGVPLDLDEAAAAIAEGDPVAIDVGRIAGRAFVNNATLGVYADQLRVRERWQRRIGKWPAAALASALVLRRFPSLRLTVEADGVELRTRTPLVVVSNNPYALEAGRPHGRKTLDAGRLGLYVVRHVGRWGFVRTAVRGLVIGLEDAETFDSSEPGRVAIRSRRRRLKVAVDGEVWPLRPPIEIESVPGGLLVVGGRAAAERGAA